MLGSMLLVLQGKREMLFSLRPVSDLAVASPFGTIDVFCRVQLLYVRCSPFCYPKTHPEHAEDAHTAHVIDGIRKPPYAENAVE